MASHNWFISLDGQTVECGTLRATSARQPNGGPAALRLTSLLLASATTGFSRPHSCLRDPLDTLPSELLASIVARLPQRSKLSCAAVSRRWRAALAEHAALVWRRLDLSEALYVRARAPVLPRLRAALQQHGRHVQELDLSGTSIKLRDLTVVAELCTSLRVLNLRHCDDLFQVHHDFDSDSSDDDDLDQHARQLLPFQMMYERARPGERLAILMQESSLVVCSSCGGVCHELSEASPAFIATLLAWPERLPLHTQGACRPWLMLDINFCSGWGGEMGEYCNFWFPVQLPGVEHLYPYVYGEVFICDGCYGRFCSVRPSYSMCALLSRLVLTHVSPFCGAAMLLPRV